MGKLSALLGKWVDDHPLTALVLLVVGLYVVATVGAIALAHWGMFIAPTVFG